MPVLRRLLPNPLCTTVIKQDFDLFWSRSEASRHDAARRISPGHLICVAKEGMPFLAGLRRSGFSPH